MNFTRYALRIERRDNRSVFYPRSQPSDPVESVVAFKKGEIARAYPKKTSQPLYRLSRLCLYRHSEAPPE